MNWEELSAIGQLLGSIAVLITLVYVALQVRHAREEMVRATRAARWAAQREYFTLMATNTEAVRASGKLNSNLGMSDRPWTQFVLQHGGTRDEAIKLLFTHWVYWSVVEQVVAGAEDLSPGELTQFHHALQLQYSTLNPAQSNWYALVARLNGNPDTVRYVDHVLADAT